jgi:mannan endo-1,4-beta-mannosidase
MKKRICLIIIPLVLAVFAVSCNTAENGDEDKNSIDYTINTEDASFEEVKVEKSTISPKTYDILAEAENFVNSDSLVVSQQRKGYSGKGYLTSISGEMKSVMSITVEIPVSQHYDISVNVASQKGSTVDIDIASGEYTESFSVGSYDAFTKVTFEGLYLEKGTITISLKSQDNPIDLDFVEVATNESVYKEEYSGDYTSGKVGTAKELLEFISENYGKNIISGQYVSSEQNTELEYIHDITGKYPAIRFDDMGVYCSAYDGTREKNVTESCINWYEQGGIVGLMMYWNAPIGNASVYAGDTDFSLSSAVTTESLSMKTEEEIEELYSESLISDSCYELLKDMDSVADELVKLKEAGVPVLWRPLHEAGGKWYWWGADGSEVYKWLWQLMYYRYTDYYDLDNLVWVWNGQSSDYLVSSQFYDIASLDIYNSDDIGSAGEQFVSLKNTVDDDNKILAISECSGIPNLNLIERDNSKWSFFGLWYDDYLYDIDKDELIEKYNSETMITLSDLK